MGGSSFQRTWITLPKNALFQIWLTLPQVFKKEMFKNRNVAIIHRF